MTIGEKIGDIIGGTLGTIVYYIRRIVGGIWNLVTLFCRLPRILFDFIVECVGCACAGILVAVKYLYMPILLYLAAILVWIIGTQLTQGGWAPMIDTNAMGAVHETNDADTIAVVAFFGYTSLAISFFLACAATISLLIRLWFLVIPTVIIGGVSFMIYLVCFVGLGNFISTLMYVSGNKYVNFHYGNVSQYSVYENGKRVSIVDLDCHESYVYGDKYKRYPESEFTPWWIAWKSNTEFEYGAPIAYDLRGKRYSWDHLRDVYHKRHPNVHKSLTVVETTIDGQDANGLGGEDRVIKATRYVIQMGDVIPKSTIPVDESIVTNVY